MSDSSATIDELLAHAGWLHGLARRLAGEAGADDLVQEVWLKATRRPPQNLESPRGWLQSALRSVHLRRLDRASARHLREREVAPDGELPSSAELAGRAEAQRLLVEAVLALDDPNRRALLLHFFEGHSAAEIARRDGEPASTVRNRIARGLEQLRERLDRRPGGRESWLSGMVLLATPERGAASVAAVSLATIESLAVWKFAVAAVSVGLLVWFGRGLVLQGAVAPSDEGLVTAEVDGAASSERPGHTVSEPRAASEDQRLALVNMPVEPSAAPLGPVPTGGPAVSGRVLDPAGQPVVGAEVFEGSLSEVSLSLRRPETPRRARAVTDAEGRYRLEFEIPSTVILSARSAGFAASPERPVELVAGERIEGIDHTLRVGATVTGVAYGIDGQPVAGRSVQVSSPDLGEFRELVTDALGRFELHALIPGPWRAATFPGDDELIAAGEPTGGLGGMAFLHQAVFVLADGGSEHLELGLVDGDSPRVHGRLLHDGEPISGLMQWYPAARPTQVNVVRADDGGAFSIELPEAGAWVAHANVMGLASRGQRFGFDLAPGAVEEIVLDLRGATLAGRVVDDAGAPVEDARVELRSVAGAPHQPAPTLGGDSVHTGADGRFTFHLLAPGSYVAVVHGSAPDGTGLPQAGTVSDAATVQGPAAVDLGDLAVVGGATVELHALDALGRPASGASLFVHDAEGRPLNPCTVTRTSSDGSAVAPVLPLGPLWVTAVRNDGVSAATVVEVGSDDRVELTLGPDRWLEVALEDGTVDATRTHIAITDDRGLQWGGLVDIRSHFAAKPEREHPERPLFGPLPQGFYTVRVESADGALKGAVELGPISTQVSTVVVH
ncbi:sigma-70 family RNA polymerase sigma factor [Engelhardtia mirabilis]|uniref:Putative ECF RNA polymerase sigma factor SigI n=1 Tax=Engelhardtia mirabilis TaxID=2528011 RepID=A0A518BE30_9BACT|nr:putative ECF RNA polymerase sigma factor SigI [Planctomycetes bacterium Pla133]QDU99558.1 putative ECF RNA polymerase sigma factor SigI [Planctomycetes bacterium Pla86]